MKEAIREAYLLRANGKTLHRIAWSSSTNRIAAGAGKEDQGVYVWQLDDQKPPMRLAGHEGSVYGVAWSPDGNLLASCSGDRTARIWSIPDQRELFRLDHHRSGMHLESWVYDLAISPDGQELVTVCHDSGVCIWGMADGQLRARLENRDGHISPIYSVAWSPDGEYIASGSGTFDSRVCIWSAKQRKLHSVLRDHTLSVPSICWSPSGELLATASHDRRVMIWRLPEFSLYQILEGHTGHVTAVRFSADGRLLASKSQDNTVRIWRTDTWKTTYEMPQPARRDALFTGIAFDPHGDSLAILSQDDLAVRVLNLDCDAMLAQGGTPTITYTSAKIVLVGESNVGKSCLAMRLAEDRYPRDEEQGTTAGMKFWPMPAERLCPEAKAAEGHRRDVVLWDMGGQDEYRLVNQLFLHDATLALVLLDPTRGRTAFEEVVAWNKRFEKHVGGRRVAKLLVGAKLDESANTIDQAAVARLCEDCGFKGYYETSALNGRGIGALRRAMAQAIDWSGIATTSRDELFQRIRDQITARREQGEIVLHLDDLHLALGGKAPTEQEIAAVDTVTEQLASQGVVVRSRVATGAPVLVLQVQEIERYAGSLIVAARDNPRGAPALELRAIATPGAPLPGIQPKSRLLPQQEQPVVECTVQLLLEHGICFQHEGLLVFPTLFGGTMLSADTAETRKAVPHAISLYYDFSGAIDNIYASLVAWLVLARDFGRVRLWADRAEFEVTNKSLCGLRKVGRPGGFAHMDVYFETATPPHRRRQFISFVEEHLRFHGVEIREHVAITCQCGSIIDEETLRKRIAKGDKDVVCPICEVRHSLLGGAAESRLHNPQLTQWTWALKTGIEKRRRRSTTDAVRILKKTAMAAPSSRPIRLLHLSDLHFTADTPIKARLQWIADDLRRTDDGLGCEQLDYLVISGDFTDKGCPEGFETAYKFVSSLSQEFGLSAQRCIFVPGNHDTADLREAYEWRETEAGLRPGEWVRQGEIILAQDPQKYPLRFKRFSEEFFHKFLQKPYPFDYAAQGMATPFWEDRIQFLSLNSCWQIDKFNRKRASVHPEAVANAIGEAQRQEVAARAAGQLKEDAPILRIAVWHHPIVGPSQMTDVDFVGHLQNAGVRICLHGDVHELRRELIGYWRSKKLHVVGTGSFGACAADRPEAVPRMYSLLLIDRSLKSVVVHTRIQPKPDGPWRGWNEWPPPDGSDGGFPYYGFDC